MNFPLTADTYVISLSLWRTPSLLVLTFFFADLLNLTFENLFFSHLALLRARARSVVGRTTEPDPNLPHVNLPR